MHIRRFINFCKGWMPQLWYSKLHYEFFSHKYGKSWMMPFNEISIWNFIHSKMLDYA